MKPPNPAKPATYKFDQPVPKYMISNSKTESKVINPMKNAKEDSNTVVISASDISRIKACSQILSDADLLRRRKEQFEEQVKNSAIANQRKAMMLKMEADRKKKVGALTETERLKKEKDALILSKAHKAWEEDMDDVKKMNSMMLYARTVAVRDGQKNEKSERIAEEKEYNDKMDAIMLMKAKKDEQIAQELEAIKYKRRLEGAEMLRKQINEVEQIRRMKEEMKEVEGKRLLAEIEKQKEEDKKKALKKHEAGKKLLAEITKFNEDQIEHKKQLAQQEREEEEKISLYVYMKDLKEQQYQEEIEKQRKLKEMETARLRAQQEKAQDKQAQMDELRAKRVQEELEREWRTKEKAEAEKQKKMNAELAIAREEQKLLKMKRLADQARHEQAEFYRVMKDQEEAVKRIKDEEEKVQIRNNQNKEEIMAQIQKHKEERERERKQELEYGEKIRLRAKAEVQILEAIKQRKLKELAKDGVPAKYRSELARKKVT